MKLHSKPMKGCRHKNKHTEHQKEVFGVVYAFSMLGKVTTTETDGTPASITTICADCGKTLKTITLPTTSKK